MFLAVRRGAALFAFGCLLPALAWAVTAFALEEPEAREIAYCYQPMIAGIHQIYAINSDGTGNHKLINSPVGLNHHSWAPDGKRLAAVGYPDAATWSIYTFAADGTGLTRLTATSNVWDSDPAWSPDGTAISFTRTYPRRSDREELWIMNADGSGCRWLGVEGSGAHWSPDGSRLVFTALRNGIRDIYTCTLDGSGEVRLTQDAAVEALPCWSPNGALIAFAASSDGSYAAWEIFVMSADGSDRQQLTDNASYDACPRWSPDGTSLAFESDRSQPQHWEIYTMAADGSNVMRVTNLPPSATGINPAWRP